MRTVLKMAALTALMAVSAARTKAADSPLADIPSLLTLLEAKTSEGKTLIPWVRERMNLSRDEGGVALKIVQDFNQVAIYDYDTQTVYVNEKFLASDPRLAACVLLHELMHAKQHLQLGYWNVVETEFEAYLAQMHAAEELGALDYSPEGKSNHEKWLSALHQGHFQFYAYKRQLYLDWMYAEYRKEHQEVFLSVVLEFYRALLKNLDAREADVRKKLTEGADETVVAQTAVLDHLQKKGLITEAEKNARLDLVKKKRDSVALFSLKASKEQLARVIRKAVEELEAQQRSWNAFLAEDDAWQQAHPQAIAKWAEIHKRVMDRYDKSRTEDQGGFSAP